MTPPIPIPGAGSRQVAVSVSPVYSPRLSTRADSLPQNIRQPKVLHPVENEDLKLLLLENISQDAVAALQAQGFHVDHHTRAMSEDELVEKISAYHAIGIRSKTKITRRILGAASKARHR